MLKSMNRRTRLLMTFCGLLAICAARQCVAADQDRKVTVAVVQFDATPEAIAENLSTMERLARSAAKEGARWIMFHEGSLCDYTDRLDELAEEVPDGPSTLRMC